MGEGGVRMGVEMGWDGMGWGDGEGGGVLASRDVKHTRRLT